MTPGAWKTWLMIGATGFGGKRPAVVALVALAAWRIGKQSLRLDVDTVRRGGGRHGRRTPSGRLLTAAESRFRASVAS